MARDWTKEYFNIPDDAKDSYNALKEELELADIKGGLKSLLIVKDTINDILIEKGEIDAGEIINIIDGSIAGAKILMAEKKKEIN